MKTLKWSALALIAITVFACSSDDDGATIDDDGMGGDGRAELYASNNSDGNIKRYDMREGEENSEASTFITLSTDSEGIHYDSETDVVTQASHSLLSLNSYADISLAEDGLNIDIDVSGSADLESPRDLAVNGNVYVVSDNANANGRFFIYTKTDGEFTLRNTVTVDFEVWGIEFIGNDLYAVVDNSADVALFTNFVANNTTDDTVEPSKQITIEGIARTHGIAHDEGTVVLTDIGVASGGDFDNDGAFHIIADFESKFNAVDDGGTMAVSGNQVRVEGSSTMLGNPVAADYDAESNTVFIAERANSGGRVLAFTDADAGGNLTPDFNQELSGASSVYYYSE